MGTSLGAHSVFTTARRLSSRLRNAPLIGLATQPFLPARSR